VQEVLANPAEQAQMPVAGNKALNAAAASYLAGKHAISPDVRGYVLQLAVGDGASSVGLSRRVATLRRH
jgi:hypothetical protein